MLRTRIGEGVAISLSPRSNPTLTLAGVPADAAFARRQAPTGSEHKLGISTGGWIAIGVGTVLVVAGVGLALAADAIEDNSE